MLFRAWVFATALLAAFWYVSLAGDTDLWPIMTAASSGMLFFIGAGLIWVSRGSRPSR